MEGFSKEERKLLSRLDTPRKIQDFVDKIEYNLENKGDTFYSPLMVLRNKKANCIEGAMFAAAALNLHKQPALLMDLTTDKENDTDHVIALFKVKGHWGAIGKSKYPGLTYREPIHKTLRELALTYFEDYFNYYSRKTLRGYSRPVSMARFGKDWMTTTKKLNCVEDYLNNIRHTELLKGSMIRNLRKVTPIMKESCELWINRHRLQDKVRKESQ
jgi:hypothetical protein